MTVLNDDQAHAVAGLLAERATGARSHSLTRIPSRSHHVFLADTVVVKLIDDTQHLRLDRELTLAAELPAGLSAPVRSSGVLPVDGGRIRYACLTRLPGRAPGMGLPGIDRVTALRWAAQAIERLHLLHRWRPGPEATACLQQPLDHGGYLGRSELLARLDDLRRLDRDEVLPGSVRDTLDAVAQAGPEAPVTAAVVHADCHWDNWLVADNQVTALLDFEWARFGEPADDWMFLARFSGQHMSAVLRLIADVTGTPLDELRQAGELREVAHVSADLRLALTAAPSNPRAAAAATELAGELRHIVHDRSWWQPA